MRTTAFLLCWALAVPAWAGPWASLWDMLFRWDLLFQHHTQPLAVVGGGELHLLYVSKEDPDTRVLTCYRRLVPGKGWTEETKWRNAYQDAAYFGGALVVFRRESFSVYGTEAWRTQKWVEPWPPVAAVCLGQELWVFGSEVKEKRHRLHAARFIRGEEPGGLKGPEAIGEPLGVPTRPTHVTAVARGGAAVVFWLQRLGEPPEPETANELWMVTFDGSAWGKPERVPLPRPRCDYAAAVHEGTLWVFCRERGRRLSAARPLRLIRSIEGGWSAPEAVPGIVDQQNWTFDLAAASFEGSVYVVRARTANVSIHRWRDGTWQPEESLAEQSLWPTYVLVWLLGNAVAAMPLLVVTARCAYRAQERQGVVRLGPGRDVIAATWTRRVAATLVDLLLVCFFLNQLVFRLLALAVTLDESTAAMAGRVGIHVALFFTYFVLGEAIGGQTIGKRLLGIRVAALDGTAPPLRGVILRCLLRPSPLVLPIAYLVGSIVLLLTSRRQRLGDLLAGTVVVDVPPPPAPEPSIDD